MTITDFLVRTQERLPSATELVELCKELGIDFALKDGRPVMRTTVDTTPIAEKLAKILSREPWRTQVLKMTNLDSIIESDK